MVDFLKSIIQLLCCQIVSIIPILVTLFYERQYNRHGEACLASGTDNKWIGPYTLGVIIFIVEIACMILISIVFSITWAQEYGDMEDAGISSTILILLIVMYVIPWQAVTLVPFILIRRYNKKYRESLKAVPAAKAMPPIKYACVVIFAVMIIAAPAFYMFWGAMMSV